MLYYILDVEANGLRPEADKIWCVTLKNIENQHIHTFYDGDDVGDCGEDMSLRLYELESELKDVIVIGHNIIDYDKWLLKKVMGIEIKNENIIDTLLLSRILRPDLKVPEGWKGKPAPHSVEAYGMRYGLHKPEHEDWSRFSKDMLIRNISDVKIQHLIYKDLIGELDG